MRTHLIYLMYVGVVKQRQRQVPGIQTVQFVDVPQVHFIDKVVDVPVVKNIQTPFIVTVEYHVTSIM